MSKKALSIGLFIITTLVFLIAYVVVIPSILSLVDKGVRNVPMAKSYLVDVCTYNLGIGIFGILLFTGVCFLFYVVNLWGERKIKVLKEEDNPTKMNKTIVEGDCSIIKSRSYFYGLVSVFLFHFLLHFC